MPSCSLNANSTKSMELIDCCSVMVPLVHMRSGSFWNRSNLEAFCVLAPGGRPWEMDDPTESFGEQCDFEV